MIAVSIAELVELVEQANTAPAVIDRLTALGRVRSIARQLADVALEDGLAVTDEFSVSPTVAARELGVTRRTIYQRRTETGGKDQHR